MTRQEVFNFSAGPSALPQQALERAGKEILNYGGSGMSVMEMSHRSAVYQEIFDSAKAKLKETLSVPEDYEVLFLQGGATLQFSAVPMNFLGRSKKADYAVTGNFAQAAYKEAARYGDISVAADTSDAGHTRIPAQEELRLREDAAYFFYCDNNTVYGTEWQYVPDTGSVPIVCDMSSNILSRPVDVRKYGLIFAGAQKNIAPAGVTVVIIDKNLRLSPMPETPLLMGYERMIQSDSMYNTPPCWCIYMVDLVLDWVAENGGVIGMEAMRREKSAVLYDFLDNSALFSAPARTDYRSCMNVVFRSASPELDALFVKEAAKKGFLNLKGHRAVGGMRASIYNAMPMEGVRRLAAFMKEFEVSHRV